MPFLFLIGRHLYTQSGYITTSCSCVCGEDFFACVLKHPCEKFKCLFSSELFLFDGTFCFSCKAQKISGRVTDKQVRSWKEICLVWNPQVWSLKERLLRQTFPMISPVKNRVFQCYRQATAVNTTVADQNTKGFKNSWGQRRRRRWPYSPVTQWRGKTVPAKRQRGKKVQHIPPQMIWKEVIT